MEAEGVRDRPPCEEEIVQHVQHVYPTLRITEYAAAKAFYVDALGFRPGGERRALYAGMLRVRGPLSRRPGDAPRSTGVHRSPSEPWSLVWARCDG